ncbi:MAG: YqgE/AlgH family protein [Acidimicrobiales bacterium]|nr:YqgE/AlgH family protein [Acidimicrobiales bacterium]
MATSLAGRLLVAVPGRLDDPNFRRTVVLMLEHGEEGGLGVVLNRPSNTPVDEPFPGWDEPASPPRVIFAGGPVQPNMIIALARTRDGAELGESWQLVLEQSGSRIGTVDLRRHPVDVAPALECVRVFAGYAGWAPGQLEEELRLGAWWVVDPLPWDPFCTDPARLWREVLRRQGGELAIFALCPDDPSMN